MTQCATPNYTWEGSGNTQTQTRKFFPTMPRTPVLPDGLKELNRRTDRVGSPRGHAHSRRGKWWIPDTFQIKNDKVQN